MTHTESSNLFTAKFNSSNQYKVIQESLQERMILGQLKRRKASLTILQLTPPPTISLKQEHKKRVLATDRFLVFARRKTNTRSLG